MDSRTCEQKLQEYERTIEERRGVCAEAYQVAGAAGAPVRALDNLFAAANGDPLPHGSMLPISQDEFDMDE